MESAVHSLVVGPCSAPPHAERLAEHASFLQRLQQGEESAFEELFVLHFRPLCTMAYAYLRSRDLAQDVVQEVLCRLWEQRATLIIRQSVHAYLGVAVRHQSLSVLRHQRVTRRVEDMPHGDEYPGLGASTGASADHAVLADEARQLVDRAVAALPERQRAVFALRWREERSYAEIASMLGVSVKGAESIRRRAIETLQKTLRGAQAD
jgi:RNA polymerase sigma-70 factor (ECF subfamily)